MNPQQPRTCGSCTACCDGWLQIEVRGHQVRPGKPCPFSIQHQCAIYGERPQHPSRELIYQVKDEWFAFGPPAFQVEMSEKIARGEKPWAD